MVMASEVHIENGLLITSNHRALTTKPPLPMEQSILVCLNSSTFKRNAVMKVMRRKLAFEYFCLTMIVYL